MTNMIEILIDDIKAAKVAFRSGNYPFINIYGNRLVTDAIILDIDTYSLAGMTLKDISILLNQLTQNNLLDDNKDEIRVLMDKIHDALKEKRPDDLWQIYFDLHRMTLDLSKSTEEKDIYTQRDDYVGLVIDYLVRHLDSDRHFLQKSNNRFIEGLTNELTRVIRSYGATDRSLVFLLMLRSFNGLYPYLLFSSLDSSGSIDTISLESNTSPYVTQIVEMFKEPDKEGMDVLKKRAAKTLDGMLSEWRLGFIRYTEAGLGVGRERAQERRIELPLETKKKIEEALEDVLKTEIE